MLNKTESVIDGRLHAVEILPGDTLVLEADHNLHPDQIVNCKKILEEQFSGVKTLVLTKGFRLGVIREANAEVATA